MYPSDEGGCRKTSKDRQAKKIHVVPSKVEGTFCLKCIIMFKAQHPHFQWTQQQLDLPPPLPLSSTKVQSRT